MNRSAAADSAQRNRDMDWPDPGTLPPLQLAELPEPPRSAWKIIGPGIVAAGVGLGASEFILFPYIASQVGLSLLWAAFIVIVMQFFIVMETERYTLATGETVLTGFSRFGRWWGAVMCVMAVAISAWPGWATGAATLLTYLFGGEAKWFAIAIMATIGVVLTLSPTAYRGLERAEIVKVAAVAVFFVGSVAFVIPTGALLETPAGIARADFPVDTLGWPMLLGALAFAGTGGGAFVCQSSWIRDKGFGMGAHAPRIVSPFVGHPVATSGTGWRFELNDEMMARWRAWWRFANLEQLITFVVICIATITLTSLLAYALLYGRPGLPSDIGFLAIQGNLLSVRVGDWFGKLFWAVGVVALFATSLGVVDISGRLIGDAVRTNYRPQTSESLIYAVVVWTQIAFGSAIILSGAGQPVYLIVLSGCISGFMTFVVSALLIRLNLALPRPLRPTRLRVAVLVGTTIFFAALSAAMIADQLGLF